LTKKKDHKANRLI